jgi:hypothetical protein
LYVSADRLCSEGDHELVSESLSDCLQGWVGGVATFSVSEGGCGVSISYEQLEGLCGYASKVVSGCGGELGWQNVIFGEMNKLFVLEAEEIFWTSL